MIGRNGSGKSNFFKAIQFVLCEKEYSNLGEKEKQTVSTADRDLGSGRIGIENVCCS